MGSCLPTKDEIEDIHHSIAVCICWPNADKFGESMTKQMKIVHAASWVSDLERACSFYERWFNATKGSKYSSTKRPFTSYFLSLGSGARLELMASPGEAPRMAHVAISVGSREAVDCLIEEMREAGVSIVSGPRLTGDGYYEAVIIDSEGNLVEITS
jgi:lactoylglutathione lyase